MKKVGVVGLGIMGHGIADNFIQKGYEVYLWNRTPEKADDLKNKGGKVLTSPKEIAEKADIIFEVTANDESSKHVWLDQDGILAATDKSNVYITCATLSVAWIDELAKQCATQNLEFLDMPMTGGREGAETGHLTLLVGGNQSTLDQLMPDLKAIASDVKYFGPVGSGTKYKLILNMLQAIHVAGLGEALRLAKASGLNEKLVGDALAERPGGTTTTLDWKDYQQEPNPINFSVEWIRKDLSYAKQMAGSVKSPLLDEALSQYDNAVAKGYSQSDWTKINRL